ncbi:PilZ domain-containing protein [Roseiarcaceae bacterium H3SJ34-1]|uniref:PilZ domain-containing protein n=1 Tax=Terripilifer ovatus TaxID=3032367 RepID=UPI003AB94C9E|nr:PilZ domain-containing protein [Roseiarcaceae bacterium H3SJ34-1]
MSWSNATLHKALRPDDLKDRRRHQRVRLSLSGRYMLSDHREYPCQTVDMSPGGVRVIAPVIGDIGSRVVIYLDHVGRLEGQIVRHVESGFAAQLRVPPLKREKLADQLTWLANRHILGLPEDRRHERIEPVSKRAILKLPDGNEITVRIIDISLSGVAINIDTQPELGTSVTIGRTKGVVIRHFPDGVAIEFLRQLPEDRFDPGIKL